MKKFFYHFFCYVGLSVILFSQPAYSKEQEFSLPFAEDFEERLKQYEGKSIIEADNEFIKLYAVYLLADKLFPDKKINDDMTVFLRKVYPTSNLERLKIFEMGLKFLIMSKRRYNYVVDRLKHKIKVDSILPKDTPIVAKDGEFAPAISDNRKKTDANSYQVSYMPYKYIGYDRGELGEPVRRRDKNYVEQDAGIVDEIILGILELDFHRLYNAFQKLPYYNDGTREKPVDLENGIRSRLLLDTSHPGKKETIDGVLEVYLPNNWYINGDILNPASRPKLYLTEDNKEDLNIKEYQLFYPVAAGVVSNGVNRRIWHNSARFPIRFTRRDITKGMNIKSEFTFLLCQAKTDECHYVTSHNSLKLAPSDNESLSIHHNFVTMSFARVPPEETKHAALKSAYYDKESGQLTVKFKAKKTFNNVAAMAEDAIGTNYGDAQYYINDDEVTVTFQSQPHPETNASASAVSEENQDVAITAMFDDLETLRIVTAPQSVDEMDANHEPLEPDYKKAFLFGLLLNLMPGLFYLLQQLWKAFSQHPNHRQIFCRYIAGAACGLLLWATYNRHNPWYTVYEHPVFLSICLFFATSYIIASAGYMDFNLFRPFKKALPRGLLPGFLSPLFAAATFTVYKNETMNNLSELPIEQSFIMWLMIFCGMLIMPIIGYLWRDRLFETIKKLFAINLPFMVVFAAELLWIIYQTHGILALLISLAGCGLLGSMWYYYPLAITETVKHKRNIEDKAELYMLIQKHCSIIILVLWLLTAGGIAVFTTPKTTPLPDRATLTTQIEQKIAHQKRLLLLIAQPQTYYHGKTLKELTESGVEILHYQISGYDKNLPQWLAAYGKANPPVNIIYTPRHKKGLSLPQGLYNINWNETMAEF